MCSRDPVQPTKPHHKLGLTRQTSASQVTKMLPVLLHATLRSPHHVFVRVGARPPTDSWRYITSGAMPACLLHIPIVPGGSALSLQWTLHDRKLDKLESGAATVLRQVMQSGSSDEVPCWKPPVMAQGPACCIGLSSAALLGGGVCGISGGLADAEAVLEGTFGKGDGVGGGWQHC